MVKISNFTGMANAVSRDDATLGRDKGRGIRDTPHVILNADPVSGVLIRRPGLRKVIDMEGLQTIWSDGHRVFGVAANALYELHPESGERDELCTLNGDAMHPVSFVKQGDKVYFSNIFDNGVIDLSTMACVGWGIEPPHDPVAKATGDGGLQPGTYNVIYSWVSSDGLASGNSAITPVELSEEGGIALTSRNPGAVVWCTEADGHVFYRVGEVDNITHIATAEPFPHLWAGPPPRMDHLTVAHGRMWGARGKTLYYSEPHRFDLWNKAYSRFDYHEKITGVAGTETGVYVGTEKRVLFLLGRDPREMSERRVAEEPMLAGSLTRVRAEDVRLSDLGEVLPVWVGGDGVYVGSEQGSATNISGTQIGLRALGAARASVVAHVQSGYHRLLASIQQQDDGVVMGDNVTAAIVRRGSVVEG